MPAPHGLCDATPPAGWRLVAWAAALVLALRVLIGLGSGPLGVPLASVDALAAWIDRTPPGTM
ncbi:MAG: hypothetical protein ACRDZN_05420, partial [Acidimicrobiales bacterium]